MGSLAQQLLVTMVLYNALRTQGSFNETYFGDIILFFLSCIVIWSKL